MSTSMSASGTNPLQVENVYVAASSPPSLNSSYCECSYHPPRSVGLYSSEHEKSACGVGLIAHRLSHRSHDMIRDGLSMLCRLAHRGGSGCDVNTGDGAGILCGIPHTFFRELLQTELNSNLPELGHYAVGLCFLSKDPTERQEVKQWAEGIVESHGAKVLAWRVVPTNSAPLGFGSAKSEPHCEQLFIIDSNATKNEQEFSVLLYILRKRLSRADGCSPTTPNTNDPGFVAPGRLYICSLSTRYIVYKGQLTPNQVGQYFLDLTNPSFTTHFALVHSRFSTNTFPSWERSQPLRTIAHNGEINTCQGNTNWMNSRQSTLQPNKDAPGYELLTKYLSSLGPTIERGVSDSGALDNVIELLIAAGRPIEEVISMLIPEAWQTNATMDPARAVMCKYYSHKIEPWDGPAFVGFTDGHKVGATLDRNGLRPGRVYILNDDRIIVSSEVGVIPNIDPANIKLKGRLKAGELFLLDFDQQKILYDPEIKQTLMNRYPFQDWLRESISLDEEVEKLRISSVRLGLPRLTNSALTDIQLFISFGYTQEVVSMLLGPMGEVGKEPLGSMGNDAALAFLSSQPRSIFDYFCQRFAQVTNPPIDPIRESEFMSLISSIGPEGNLLINSPLDCQQRITLTSPMLSPTHFDILTNTLQSRFPSTTLDMTFPYADGPSGLLAGLKRLCLEAELATRNGSVLLILSDRQVSPERVPISSLLVVGAIHQSLIKLGLRTRISLIVECGDACEVHHMCLLLGFGSDSIFPYGGIKAVQKYHLDKVTKPVFDPSVDLPQEIPEATLTSNYLHALELGILQVMAKIGISTLGSYKGAQIFEAVGVSRLVMDLCFTGCSSRICACDFEVFARDLIQMHDRAFGVSGHYGPSDLLPHSGDYQFSTRGEAHMNRPDGIAKLQEAARTNSRQAFQQYSRICNEQAEQCTIRGQLKLIDKQTSIPLDEVESVASIVKRFSTGAMSYGSISLEAHTTIAIAMNTLGGKSNTGEGGEHHSRFELHSNGDNSRSAIKQIASGRFGVTINYLSDADELQIKMSQGAKPGEGGELPGDKVQDEIASTRLTTPGVGLISPPPHHDIYSIEDLAQLIYDLHNANPSSRISVKLVAEVGVGVVAAGVVKAKAGHILISGHDGGTGASKWTSIKHAGVPWELGLAETHQTLVLNGLRGRVVLQTDGQLKTGLDIIKAGLLGAEEFCFATAPLITLGCIMMRKCHLNTCPVGIATQDPELRRFFAGKPEHLINFFWMLGEEVREYMAFLGIRTFKELVGRTDLLEANGRLVKGRIQPDYSSILVDASQLNPGGSTSYQEEEAQIVTLDQVLDSRIYREIASQLDQIQTKPIHVKYPIMNTDRSAGTLLSHRFTKRFRATSLPKDSLHISLEGSAGQSFGCFLASSIFLDLIGDACDYVGKGLSGGTIAIQPPKTIGFNSLTDTSQDQVIVGNVCFYGATSGQAFIRGRALQRFAVRNSGANVVVEGLGDHGLEYMTGGIVVCLGTIGRNFGAGMSGGVAYVYDPLKQLSTHANLSSIDLEPVVDECDIASLRSLITLHLKYTNSYLAERLLWSWSTALEEFVKVMPKELKAIRNKSQTVLHTIASNTVIRDLVDEEEKDERKASDGCDSPVSSNSSPITKSGCDDCSCSSIGGGCKSSSSNSLHSFPSPSLDLEDIGTIATVHLTRPKVVSRPSKLRGFIEYERGSVPYRKAEERFNDYNEIFSPTNLTQLTTQSARCMDCGVPFCHDIQTGCPLGNRIPEWNELVYSHRYHDAWLRLMDTNNFPEFTGRVCPAPCESGCVLGVIDQPVTIKNIEAFIIQHAWEQGWMKPRTPHVKSGKQISIIGSGPAGLAAADQLNQFGHTVTVYERADRIGGLLMYGIPNMKLDKTVVERRIQLMKDEGIKFITNMEVGVQVQPNTLLNSSDAVLLTIGATKPRDLPIPNRSLHGIYFAMDFLKAHTKSFLDSRLSDGNFISAKDKVVLVIGGGDTGADCIATSIRHGSKKVINFELLPEPSTKRDVNNPWPEWPRIFRVDYGHEEGRVRYGEDPRIFSILSKQFVGESGKVTGVETVQVEWNGSQFKEVIGSSTVIRCDLVLLAMGFLGPETTLAQSTSTIGSSTTSSGFNVSLDARGNLLANTTQFRTSTPKVFAAGDCRKGQSLIVHAINEGRLAAKAIHTFMTETSSIL